MKIVKVIDETIAYEHWLPVWQASTNNQLDEKVTRNTWDNLINPAMPLFGFILYTDREIAAGILHYALHLTTGAIEPAVYMQDLYVSEKYRRRGYARALVKEFLKRGQQEQWDRAIWLVEKNNAAAEKLYDEFATKLEFDFYIHGIAMLRRLMN